MSEPPSPSGISGESGRPGLTSTAALAHLLAVGANEVVLPRRHALLRLLATAWGPVPAMLEASAVLEATMRRWTDVVIIGSLLCMNSVISFVTEDRAQRATELLRSRLTMTARVMRDGSWQELPARDLVPEDIVRVRVGDVMPADGLVLEGEVLLDRAALTGESAPVTVTVGAEALAGTTVRRGEVTMVVTATGARSRFGRTAQLVATSTPRSSLSTLVMRIVRALLVFDGGLVLVILLYAWWTALPLHDAVLFSASLLIAAVPIALPATFALTAAVGTLELTRRGVFVTHLSAIEDAATMDILCCDKTGTLTENRLAVGAVRAMPPFTEIDVLRFAAACSDASTRDPLDLAILAAAPGTALRRFGFVPFDPSTKRAEAVVEIESHTERAMKGAPAVLAAMSHAPDAWRAIVEGLAADGSRVLAVAKGGAGPGADMHIVGFIGLRDALRHDSKAIVADLRRLGVQIRMLTGDASATATAVARDLGIEGPVLDSALDAAPADPERYEVFAGIYPEGKHALVDRLERGGHVVGMTGDGVNDAPALRRADVGIAVASATDVAKAAASVILTAPGLASIVDVVETGRRIYQRLLTYTLNKLVKTVQISTFLTIGLVWLGQFVVRPRHVLLLLLANDLVTMSIATDRVQPSLRPDRWSVAALLRTSLPIAVAWTVFSLLLVFVARSLLHYPLGRVQSLAFVGLVASGQANVYLVRARAAGTSGAPSPVMLAGTSLALVGTAALVLTGTLTARLSALAVLCVFGAGGAFLVMLRGLLGHGEPPGG